MEVRISELLDRKVFIEQLEACWYCFMHFEYFLFPFKLFAFQPTNEWEWNF
jgi:hypothetical protein